MTGIKTKFGQWLDKANGKPIEWSLKEYKSKLGHIDKLSAKLNLKNTDDHHIQARAGQLRKTIEATGTTDQILYESYALVREASDRVLGMRHFDVQMLAGIALSNRRVIQMNTGEGKTLVALLPAFLNALSGQGVHVLTFNDYLAKRDAHWMGPVYEFLGLSVGYIEQGSSPEQRKTAYDCDITYLTARQVGYDLLRQGLARNKNEIVARPFNFAIVDEADSILIDEARVPLVIAGKDHNEEDSLRRKFAQIAAQLIPKEHYLTDENSRNVFLTPKGESHVEEILGCDYLYQKKNQELITMLNQALHAIALIKKDVDYIVTDGQVKIVDEFTGRVVNDRHWPDGLHRAAEAKENLQIKDQGRILGSISMQHLIQLYPNLCGMTGTVIPSQEEFDCFYDLKTVIIPPNKPCIRKDEPDVIFTHKAAKNSAIVKEVKRVNKTGRPILIGTCSVEESQQLAQSLKDQSVKCNVLNASNDEAEAAIISEAGALSAVTVSTNMAGRGTDIRLGGSDEKDREKVLERDGLYVIGTNRHESKRVDDQLRGRAGRQGDPGSSCYFVSLDDDLMEQFKIRNCLPKNIRAIQKEGPVEEAIILNRIEFTQRIIDGQNLDIRNSLWKYTSFVEKQRLKIQSLRDGILTGQEQGWLEKVNAVKYLQLKNQVDAQVLAQAEKQICLYHIDRCWSDHLASIADIREGVYLKRLGGKDPLHEFFVLAGDSYCQMMTEIDEEIARTFGEIELTNEGLDLDKAGLRGPSSTWTYLVNDNPFDWLGHISSQANIGLGIAAGLWGGLFVVKAIYQKLANKRRDT